MGNPGEVRAFNTKWIPTPGWFKIRPAAVYAGVEERTARKWLKTGLRFSKAPTGAVLIKKEWLDEFLEGFEVKGEDRAEQIANTMLKGLGG